MAIALKARSFRSMVASRLFLGGLSERGLDDTGLVERGMCVYWGVVANLARNQKLIK